MPKPVFIEYTLRAKTEVLRPRHSASRPNAGIFTFWHKTLNQRDEIVCRCKRSALIGRRLA